MIQLRPLVTSLLASGLLAPALVLTAAAQSAPALSPLPLTATIAIPSVFPSKDTPAPSTISPLNLPPGSYTFKSPNDPALIHITVGKPFNISKEAEKYLKLQHGDALTALHNREALLAHSQTPCLKLRSYNFTARDLKSPNPSPSSETDCTPASKGHLLNLPATVTTSPSTVTNQTPVNPK